METTGSANAPRDGHDDLPFEVVDQRRLNRASFAVSNQLFDRFGPELGIDGISVFLVLSRFAAQDRTCSLPLATITNLIGMSRKRIHRALAKLRMLELITGSWRGDQIEVRLLI